MHAPPTRRFQTVARTGAHSDGDQHGRASTQRRNGFARAVLGLALILPGFLSAWAEPLGVLALKEVPETRTDASGRVIYTPGDQRFSVTTSAYQTFFQDGIHTFWEFNEPRSIEVDLIVDTASCAPNATAPTTCGVLPGPGIDGSGINLRVIGTIPTDGYAGVLLEGSIAAMGFANGALDAFDFRFVVVGGEMAPLFDGKDIGMRFTTEGSSFDGSFLAPFSGTSIKGSLFAIPSAVSSPSGIASLGDRVTEDLNGDGVQNCPDANDDGIIGNESEADLTGAGYETDDYPECFSGIGNVPVELRDPGTDGICGTADDVVVTDGDGNSSVLTDVSGFYKFAGLSAGRYCVVVAIPEICAFGPAGFTRQDQGGDNAFDSDVDDGGASEVVTLIDGLQAGSLDAAVVCPAKVGDLLYDDGDHNSRNGRHDDGEPGIAGETVELYLCDGIDGEATGLADTTTTDAGGLYSFLVEPGQVYAVQFTRPATSTGFTDQDVGADATDSDVNASGSSGCIVQLASNEENLTFDGGVFTAAPGSRFGSTLFHDKNGNGIQEGGEPGVQGVTVNLYEHCSGLDADGRPIGTLFDTQYTDESGGYDSGEVFDGAYCVEFVPPAELCFVDGVDFGGPTFTQQDQGSDDALDSDVDPLTGVIAPFFLPDGTNDLTRDAGIHCQGRVGDRLWDDTDRIDGVQSTATAAEPGIGGIEVTLYACIDGVPDTATGVATLTTGVDGFYEALVDPGSYAVGIDRTALEALGFVFTLANQETGTDGDGFDSDADRTTGLTACFDVASQEADLSRDAGAFTPIAALGDYCFHDLNANGVQDDQEPGVPGCTVDLYENPDGGACEFDTALSSSLSTAGGLYMFENLVGGDYCLKLTPPADFCIDPATGADLGPLAFSPRDQGSDDAADSDVNAYGETASFSLGYNQTDMTRDAGLYCQAAVGDRVFIDANADGRQNCGDTDGDGVIGEGPFDGADGDTGDECGGGLGGVTVNLREPAETADPSTASRCDSDAIGAILDTQQTDADGFYLFGPRMPGDYCVEIVRPDDSWTCTGLNLGDDSGDSDLRPAEAAAYPGDALACITPQTITLPSRTLDRTWDGGLWQPASLGDSVFEDTNGNGRQDAGEPPVPGVGVSLSSCTGEPVLDADGQPVAGRMTGADGQYLFENLVPGCYQAQFIATGRVLTISNPGDGVKDPSDSDASPIDGRTEQVRLASGEVDLTWDAGLLAPPPDPVPASLGNRAFDDLNRNGRQDDGEPGVQGVQITLTDPAGNSMTTATDAEGEYLFADLTPGVAYGASCEAPDGYGYTPIFSQARDADTDSNADPANNGSMGSFSLGDGEYLPTVDCGLVRPGPEVCPVPAVDGEVGDWDLAGELFARLYEAGNPDKDHLADAYVRHNDGTLSVLVLATDGNSVSPSAEDAWVKIYDFAKSPQVDGNAADFEWVYIDGDLRGYEASFDLAPGTYAEVEFHLNVNGGDTASTGKKKQGYISLTTVESCPTEAGGGGGDADDADDADDAGEGVDSGDTGDGGDAGDSGDVGDTGDAGGSGQCPPTSVDGDAGDWDLNDDFFAKLHEAGKANKDHFADAHVRYTGGELHVLVLATPGNSVSESAQDAWVKIYDLGNATQVDGDSADFRWVYAGGELRGYEASFALPAGSYGEVEIHLSVNGDDTASTGKKKQGYLPLEAVERCPAGTGG
jgi:hypothetical protein